MDDINFFMTNLSHLPLNGALLNLVRIEVNPFSQEQRNSTVFMLSGEKIDQQSFYALQQTSACKVALSDNFLSNELTPDEQKLYRFKLDFSKSKRSDGTWYEISKRCVLVLLKFASLLVSLRMAVSFYCYLRLSVVAKLATFAADS